MHITKDQIVELHHLHEDMAEYFCDDNEMSGETYWTCLEAMCIAKLAELRGDIILADE
tara:strand:+ start:2728 stop:2901 length:174 start_codon:yes stop_codon:yes gene_type:complete